MSIRKLRTVVAAWCLIAIVLGQTSLLQRHAAAQGEVGRPPLPPGIVRLPFDGPEEITQVPGCGTHDRNAWNSREGQELNGRAFDFGLYQEPVLAAGEGDVISTYTDPYGAIVLVIDHGNGVRSHYVHLQEFLVNEGDHVQAGQVIGISGNTGFGAEYHLHFAVTINNDDNPASIGDAANINSLPGIPWAIEQPNEDGYVSPCRPAGSVADIAVGGAVAQEPDAPDAADEPVPTAHGYDRAAAVDAANRYLYDAYAFEEEDSAWYVSRVLWAGGLPMTDVWNDDAALGLTDPDMLIPSIPGGPGVPAAIPHDLVSYLDANGIATITRLDWSDNNAADADLGDVIAYDWEDDGIIDHVAVVTNINGEGYPEVSEHSPTHENRYWTYSEVHGDWIEIALPGSVAYLIKI